jgi:SAM-dependent methyltransferase
MHSVTDAERARIRQTEAEYFNSHAASIGEFNPFADRGWQTLSKCFQRIAGARNNLILLDVGCGTGHSRQIYIDRCSTYTGIDLSRSELDLARQKFPHDTWLEADACAMPFPDDHFDAVCFSSVLHHIPEMHLAIQEAYRVLKPGGLLFAYDPNVYHPAMALFRHPKSPLYSPVGVSPNEKPLKPKAISSLLKQKGFTNIQQWCQSNIPYREVAPKGFSAFLKVYNTLDWCWQYSGMGYFFGTFIISGGVKPDKRLSDREMNHCWN